MWAVFSKAFRDSRRSILWFSIGLGVFTIINLVFYPTILDQQEELNELMESMPTELMGILVGGSDMEGFDLADLGTYLHGQVMFWIILALGAMVTFQAFNAITNAERNGTMDVMMSFPITRREMLLGRFLNTAASTLLILTGCLAVLVGSAILIPEIDATVFELALVTYGAFFLLMVQAGLTYMVAAIAPSSQRWAGSVVYTVFFGSYLLFGFAGIIDFIDQIRGLLLFNYYDAGVIFNEGVDLGSWALLSVVTLVYVAVALWRFDRKQLGV